MRILGKAFTFGYFEPPNSFSVIKVSNATARIYSIEVHINDWDPYSNYGSCPILRKLWGIGNNSSTT
jgi:hypothetical protein